MPRDFNAAVDLIERNLAAGRAGKLAFRDDRESLTYGELAEQVDRCANALCSLGLEPEQRVMLLLLDTIDFPVAFLGAIKGGLVPVPVNTLLTPADYDFMLRDSRARALVVSDALYDKVAPLLAQQPALRHVIVSGAESKGRARFRDLLAGASPRAEAAHTLADDVCFWLYSSGSTGAPKGAVHLHSHLTLTAELYAKPILGIVESDVVFSAAKLFFAYGLGNALTFPLSVGATVLLMGERPTPEAVFKRWRGEVGGVKPTVFYGAPTGFAGMLAAPGLPEREEIELRLVSSAGEALPAEIGERFKRRFGVDIIDGIGSTEMLHIFISNRPDRVRYGTTGWPVPGYDIELRGEGGAPVPDGEPGDLFIHGPSSALMYWGNREKTRETFQGGWTKSGDKYIRNADGSLTYAGRTDDMLKVSGVYVSPFEVEATLVQHPAVLEAAVIGAPDAEGLTKTKAFVVLRPGGHADDAELKAFVKDRLAPYKYPRAIEFVAELPKTATGKIQRFKLREMERARG
ncbi:MAG TPA: benzoate-CoA ligase family protein [Stellaceae bacterium]|nr:benzoate-CoA ligase family protein [Stellaceae bacterium]